LTDDEEALDSTARPSQQDHVGLSALSEEGAVVASAHSEKSPVTYWIIKAFGTLWTGTSWATELDFAKKYGSLQAVSDALDKARAKTPEAYIVQMYV
jgi:DNA segregation ATPase FtsK/SpoIIIE-like protein